MEYAKKLVESNPSLNAKIGDDIASMVTTADLHKYKDAIERIVDKLKAKNFKESHIFIKRSVKPTDAVGSVGCKRQTLSL